MTSKTKTTRVRHANGDTYAIQGWNQPEGDGRGWAPCPDAKAERFFVFDGAGQRCMRAFKTRAEARDFLLSGGDPH